MREPLIYLCLSLVCLACFGLVLACLMAPSASAFDSYYMPFSARALSYRIVQSLLADPLQAGDKPVYAGKTKIEIPAGGKPFYPGSSNLLVHGTDKAGKPWSFVSSAWTNYASIWTADLDRNGMEDLIFLMPTGGCGSVPSGNLVVLMFEKNGRPIPFVVDGYFQVDSHGVKDFVDLENDGHCELIRQSIDDGYWITSLYQASASRWHRLNNIGGIALPLYTRFTSRQNHQAIKPPAFRHPFEADLSNDRPGLPRLSSPRFLTELDWCGQDPWLLLSDGKRCRPQSGLGTLTVVLDEPAGRRMASSSAAEAVHRLLNDIRARGLPLSMSGARQRTIAGLSSQFIFAQGRSGDYPAAPSRRNFGKSLDLALSASDNNPEPDAK